MKDKKQDSLEFNLRRENPFSFTCRACSRCCTGKIILVGPHEILGMSRQLGITTTEFLSLYTENGGTALRFLENGRCVFSGASGCRVHPQRPLVCRLYPLGRNVDANGEESFAQYAVEPGCEADRGGKEEGETIADFLESQGVEPHLEWGRLYGAVTKRIIEIIDRIEPGLSFEGESTVQETGQKNEKEEAHGDDGKTMPLLSSWQDIDLSLAEYCESRGLAIPTSIEKQIALHLQALEEWLDELESGLEREGG